MFLTTEINKTHSVKKAFYSFTNDADINEHNTINTNVTHSITKINKLVNFNDNNYFTKEMEHNNTITNSITRHNHNKYEHDVIKKVHKPIKRIINHDTEINYYSKKSNYLSIR